MFIFATSLSGSFHLGSVDVTQYLPPLSPHMEEEIIIQSLSISSDMEHIACVAIHPHAGTYMIEIDVSGLHTKMATIDKLSRAQQNVLQRLSAIHHSCQKMTADYHKVKDEHTRQLNAVSSEIDRKAFAQMMLDLFVKGSSASSYRAKLIHLLNEEAIEQWQASVTTHFTHIVEQHDAGVINTLQTLKKIFHQFMGEQLFQEALSDDTHHATTSPISAHIRQILFLINEIESVGRHMIHALEKEKKGFEAFILWLYMSISSFFS